METRGATIQNPKELNLNKHQLECRRYDRDWNKRRQQNHEHNMQLFQGRRATTGGLKYFGR